MTVIIKQDILEHCASFFQGVRRNLIEATEALYRINSENLWESKYSSFTEYIETECQISASFASKLLKNWKYFVIEGGMKPKQLGAVDYEKAYLSINLPDMTPEQKLLRAETWSRSDLKAELAVDENGHECSHENIIKICEKCHKRII